MNILAVTSPAQLGIKMISIAPSNFVFQGVQGVLQRISNGGNAFYQCSLFGTIETTP